MFLGGLRTKSILRKIKELVRKRMYKQSKNGISSLGIINSSAIKITDYEVDEMAKLLGVSKDRVQLLSFEKKLAKEDQGDQTLFTEKNIGWNGAIKSAYLKDFTMQPFDVLISYYKDETSAPYLITAASKAHFKVGIDNGIVGLNDLIVYKERMDFKTFQQELKKYLSILKIAS